MKTSVDSEFVTTVAATVAGEDLRCGDFITLLNATFEIPSYMWDQVSLPARAFFVPATIIAMGRRRRRGTNTG